MRIFEEKIKITTKIITNNKREFSGYINLINKKQQKERREQLNDSYSRRKNAIKILEKKLRNMKKEQRENRKEFYS